MKKTWELAVSHNWLPFLPFPQLHTSVLDKLHDLHTKYFSYSNNDSPMEYLEES